MDIRQVMDDNIDELYEWLLDSDYHIEIDDDGLTIDSEEEMLTAYFGDYIVKTRDKIVILEEDDYLLRFCN